MEPETNPTPDAPPARSGMKRLWHRGLDALVYMMLGALLGGLLVLLIQGPFGRDMLRLGAAPLLLGAVLLILVGVGLRIWYRRKLAALRERFPDLSSFAVGVYRWIADPARRREKPEWIDELLPVVVSLLAGARIFALIVALTGALIGLTTVMVTYMQVEVAGVQNRLFFEQNRLFVEQNEVVGQQNEVVKQQKDLTVFEQAVRFRELLYRPPLDSIYERQGPAGELRAVAARWPGPADDKVNLIRQLLLNVDSSFVGPAMRPLLQDPATSVSSGAVLVLYGSPARLDGANLVGANLSGKQLPGIRLEFAEASYARLNSANMQGARLYRAVLRHASLKRADLRGADMKEAGLKEADLEGARLDGANLSEAELEGARLRMARLDSARLDEAVLLGAHLVQAELRGTSLRDANLSRAQLYRMDLTGADLRGAIFAGAQGWRGITRCRGARIDGLRDAPEGLREHLLGCGAVDGGEEPS